MHSHLTLGLGNGFKLALDLQISFQSIILLYFLQFDLFLTFHSVFLMLLYKLFDFDCWLYLYRFSLWLSFRNISIELPLLLPEALGEVLALFLDRGAALV